MMPELFRIIILGLTAVIFIAVLKKQSSELAVLLGLAACLIIGIFILRFFEPIYHFIEEMRDLCGLDPKLFEPVLKALGIGLLTQICSNISIDSGQTAIGKMVEISGSILSIYVSLPLFNSIVELVQNVGGGG